MGFTDLPVDQDFARRSAVYLARNGCSSDQIVEVLVAELELDPMIATAVLTAAANDLVAA